MKLAIATLLLVVIASCSDNPITWPESWYESNDAAHFEIGRKIFASRDSSSVIDFAGATFRHPDSIGVYGGEVTVNGVPLQLITSAFRKYPPNDTTVRGVTYELSNGAPIRLGGGPQVFRATGGDLFPAFLDSIASSIEELHVTSPSVTDTIRKSNGFTVQWTPSSGTSSRINIRLLSYNLDTANPDVGSDIDLRDLPDNGSYTFTSQALVNYVTGRFWVTVHRYVMKEGEYKPNRRYSMKVSSEVVARMVLAP